MFMKLRGSPRPAQFIVLFSALACSLAPTPLHALSDTTDPAAACAAKNRIGSVVVDHITFVTYSSNAGTCLQAVAAGKVVYRSAVDSMQSFTLGQPASTDGNYFAVPQRRRRYRPRPSRHDRFTLYRRRALLHVALRLRARAHIQIARHAQ
jgi:hypothetical protein